MNIGALKQGSAATPATMARIAGLLYLCGAALNILALRLPHPAESYELGLYAIAGLAIVTGAAFLTWAERLPVWMINLAIATGSALVALCIYFSAEIASVYATMLVWVAVITACFFPGRPAAAHLAWLLVAYGAAIIALDGEGTGFSPVTWWLLTSFGLIVVAFLTAWLVSGTRNAEEALRAEMGERLSLQRQLEHLANHDPLTGLANRRRLELELERELSRAQRTGAPLCLGILDLDHFKAYNDSRGHAAGDQLLREAAKHWLRVLRPSDLLARYGGDEFVAVLPDCGEKMASAVADRLREALPEGQRCSVGIECWDRTETAAELLARADQAMYARKGTASSERA